MRDEKERTLKAAARYLGLKGPVPPEVAALLERAYESMREAATPRHVLRRCPVNVDSAQGLLSFGSLPPARSRNLCSLLEGCQEGYGLLCTLGMGIDMLIRRLAVTEKGLSAAVGACASAYIDVYIDGVLEEQARQLAGCGVYLTPRFSPGYGDAPLSMQRDLLPFLEARKLQVSLTESLLMLPEKSVSAVMGITAQPSRRCQSHCEICAKVDCPFREENA